MGSFPIQGWGKSWMQKIGAKVFANDPGHVGHPFCLFEQWLAERNAA
jgi:hypothetical protein